MARQYPILPDSWPADTQVDVHLVVVASDVNAGNVMLPAGAGALSIIGVTKELASSSNSQYEVGVDTMGIVQCTFLTGTAISVGQQVQVGDSAGRIIPFTNRLVTSIASGTRVGIVGVALQAVASNAATGTLVDVLLTPGVTGIQ